MWEIDTTVGKRERAIIVLQDTLEGNIKAKKVVCDICEEELYTDNGMAVLF